MTKTTLKRAEQKRKLIEKLGGKCQVCGYCKNTSSLDFHHRDRKQKESVIGHLINFHRFEDAEREAEKCDILCKNCHGEFHNPELTIVVKDGIVEYLNPELKKVNRSCFYCGEYAGGMVFCSEKCSGLSSRRVKNRPSKEELKKLLEEHSFVAVGKMFDVSDNAIRKWLK